MVIYSQLAQGADRSRGVDFQAVESLGVRHLDGIDEARIHADGDLLWPYLADDCLRQGRAKDLESERVHGNAIFESIALKRHAELEIAARCRREDRIAAVAIGRGPRTPAIGFVVWRGAAAAAGANDEPRPLRQAHLLGGPLQPTPQRILLHVEDLGQVIRLGHEPAAKNFQFVDFPVEPLRGFQAEIAHVLQGESHVDGVAAVAAVLGHDREQGLVRQLIDRGGYDVCAECAVVDGEHVAFHKVALEGLAGEEANVIDAKPST